MRKVSVENVEIFEEFFAENLSYVGCDNKLLKIMLT